MPEPFRLFAEPWWVNLLIVVPALVVLQWRKRSLAITTSTLVYTGVFAAGFGFVEAAVVVYLRAALGLLPGYHGTLAEVQRQAHQLGPLVAEVPQSLLTVEVGREAATMVML